MVTAPPEVYALSLHDALPISRPGTAPTRAAPRLARRGSASSRRSPGCGPPDADRWARGSAPPPRSEEHTSELQSHSELVCRLLLEKKKREQRSSRRH